MELRLNKIIYRLISGHAEFNINNKIIKFNPPTIDLLNRADFFYIQAYNSVKFNGWPIKDSHNLAKDFGLWSIEKDQKLDSMQQQIKDLKKDMFFNYESGKSYNLLKVALTKLKKDYKDLYYSKHCFDHLTVEGYAECLKNEYIVRESIESNEPLTWKEYQKLYNIIRSEEIGEDEYRQIARNSLWLSYWTISKHHVFMNHIHQLNYEQRIMCNIARMYENAYNSIDCPEEVVLDDPDLFDGWMYSRNEKKEAEKVKREIDKKIPANKSHVFVVANEKLTPQIIHNMNRT